MVDGFVQRLIDFMNSIPTLPLWMALSAAMPANLNPLVTYFGITVILSLISWTGVARVTRTKFISIKNEDSSSRRGCRARAPRASSASICCPRSRAT